MKTKSLNGPFGKRGQPVYIASYVSILLITSLPFVVPFGAVRNIDMQGLLLVIAGVLAWAVLLLRPKDWRWSASRIFSIFISSFALACLVSLFANPHFGYDLLGSPYLRLGTAGLLSCIGCGLLLARLPAERLVIWLYASITVFALISVPYNEVRLHTLYRIGGLFAQADVFACLLGCGLLMGLQLLHSYPRWRQRLLVSQFLLLSLLVLTETRAVLAAVLLLSAVWALQGRTYRAIARGAAIYFVMLVVLLVGLHFLAPSRLTDVGYASDSLRYRLRLESNALQASRHKLWWGYGAGNLADALACPNLSGRELQATCHEGYFFNSSHNIFIDRALAIGWLGGLAFAAIICLSAYRGLRGQGSTRLFGYIISLIAIYYLTNVTSLVLELLLWILVLQVMNNNISKQRHG